ncbi:MAG: hypothetical protein ACUVV4_04385 [Candidatus Bathyarchaeia archaeon]
MDEMEKKVKRTEGAYSRKVRQAAHLLFFKHHRLPGVRGWELKQELGSDWLEVLEVLDNQLKTFDLQVSHVLDEPDINLEPSREQLLEARFYITMSGDVDQKTVKTIGWRIDDIAGLAVAVAYIISKQGKASRSEVEKILMEKLPGWRVKANIDNYIDEGYLGQTDSGLLYLDWRSRAEIDEKRLVDLILNFGKQTP